MKTGFAIQLTLLVTALMAGAYGDHVLAAVLAAAATGIGVGSLSRKFLP